MKRMLEKRSTKIEKTPLFLTAKARNTTFCWYKNDMKCACYGDISDIMGANVWGQK